MSEGDANQSHDLDGANVAGASLVPWRETRREIIDLVGYETRQEADRNFEISREVLDEQWTTLVARINAMQGSIKSVTVFSRGKTHTYHEHEMETYYQGGAGYGFGYGWGVEIPNFIEVIYQARC